MHTIINVIARSFHEAPFDDLLEILHLKVNPSKVAGLPLEFWSHNQKGHLLGIAELGELFFNGSLGPAPLELKDLVIFIVNKDFGGSSGSHTDDDILKCSR